nr:hypothetical protein [Planctomycetota bacterium]
KRTFQNVIPLHPVLDNGLSSDALSARRGYLVISENDPDNDADDLIQFTVDASITTQLLDTTPYFGKATVLGGTITSAGKLPELVHPNQPETDDAKISADNTSQSPYAEICYFMRGGNLYRRILLIRKPLDLETTITTQPVASQDPALLPGTVTDGLSFFNPVNGLYSGNFWDDFDFSAFRFSSIPYATFHDVNSFNNSSTPPATFPLGRPQHRFGYNHLTGLPREYVDDSTGTAQFIGRFTHQETSDPDFLYPQANSTVGGGSNPMNPSSSPLEFDNARNVVSQYASGLRRAEDLVLSNVLSFDIKLFDQAAGQFVDIGSATAVDYQTSATPDYHNDNPNSTTFARNIFDTWHVDLDIDNADSDNDNTTGEDLPPFSPVNGSGVRIPLSAIQITIRYRDISSQQIRQMTIIQPLRHLVED